jgi:hypothetical protein
MMSLSQLAASRALQAVDLLMGENIDQRLAESGQLSPQLADLTLLPGPAKHVV